MPYKLLKYWQILWPLLQFHLFPSLGTANTFVCVAIWEISTIFPHIIGSLAIKAVAFFKNFIILIIKSPIDPCFIQILCHMYGQTQKISIISPLLLWPIGNKSSGIFQNFIICILCMQYGVLCMVQYKSHIVPPLVWLIGCKCRGNYQNFDNFPSIFHHLVHIVKPSP